MVPLRGQAWIEGLTLGGRAFTRDDMESEALDRFICRAYGVNDDGVWIERGGPVCVEWGIAFAWCRAAASSVWVNVEGQGRWHDGSARTGSAALPDNFLDQLSPTRWNTLSSRMWTAAVRLELGLRDFDAAAQHLEDRERIALIEGVECALDEASCSIEMRCRVLAPTVSLARELSAGALRFWISGPDGLEDELHNCLQATTVHITSGDGSSLPYADDD